MKKETESTKTKQNSNDSLLSVKLSSKITNECCGVLADKEDLINHAKALEKYVKDLEELIEMIISEQEGDDGNDYIS